MGEPSKKPWCKSLGDTACNCRVGDCLAERNADYLTKLRTLSGYGLTDDEIVDDMKNEVIKP